MSFDARAGRLLLAGLALGAFAWPLAVVAQSLGPLWLKLGVLSPIWVIGGYGIWEARCLMREQPTVARLAEHADDLIAGMKAARELTGVESEPEPDLIALATREAAERGLTLYVHRQLNEAGVIETFIVVETGRGPVRSCPAMMPQEDATWEDVVAALLGRE